MEVTVRATGPTLEQLTRTASRNLRTANRSVGRQVAKVGRKAITAKAPRMFGRKLTTRPKVNASAATVTVLFPASPAGAWAIAETGADPHPIRPRQRKALRFGGRFAAHVNHPGVNGAKAWTAAGRRLERAVRPAIEDEYDEALDA